MPIQDYNIYTGKGYAGDLYDSAPRVTQTGVVEDATLGYGLALQAGVGDRGVVVGSSNGNVFAISMRELNREATNRPSDGETGYKETESASIMLEGFILVELTGAATAHNLLNIVTATGEFAGTGALGGGESATLNVVAMESGQAGQVIKARIDIYNA